MTPINADGRYPSQSAADSLSDHHMNAIAQSDVGQSLLASLRDRRWIKLPLAIMRDVGAASQTFGGLLKLTNRETFRPVEAIAAAAELPTATARKHLKTLAKGGWIVNAGRGRTPRGAPRRTCTLRITEKGKAASREYLPLPTGIGKRLPWSAKAVLAVICGRLLKLMAAVDQQDGISDAEADDYQGSIENMGGSDRFAFSLNKLTAITGLTRESIVEAKRVLARLKIIDWYGRDERGLQIKNLLVPAGIA